MEYVLDTEFLATYTQCIVVTDVLDFQTNTI